MYNYYIQFDSNNKFEGFDIQLLRQEPHLIDEEYIEKVPVVVKKPKVLCVDDNLKSEATEDESQEKSHSELITIDIVEYIEETRIRKAHARDENGNLLFDIIEVTPLPNNAFIITSEQYSEYQSAYNSQIKDIVLLDGKIEIVDKFTTKELAAQESERVKEALIAEAKLLLSQSDYRVTVDKLKSYTSAKHAAVEEYREALRNVIRQAKTGKLIDLPILEF